MFKICRPIFKIFMLIFLISAIIFPFINSSSPTETTLTLVPQQEISSDNIIKDLVATKEEMLHYYNYSNKSKDKKVKNKEKMDDINGENIIIDNEYINVLPIIESYISKHTKNKYKNDSDYKMKLLDGYLKLFLEEDDKNLVLFYIALCHQESNFDHYVKSSAGAEGIAQVIWKWHGKYSNELGYTKKNYLQNPEDGIYVGYKIFYSYLKSSGYNKKLACRKYSGGHKGYYESIVKKYENLRREIKVNYPEFFS